MRRAARSSAATSGSASPASGGDRLDGLVGLLGRPAEADQALLHLVAPRLRGAAAGARRGGADRGADPVLELEDDPLGALLADAGHRGQRLDVVAGDRAAQRRRA